MSDNMPSLVPQPLVAGPFGTANPAGDKIYTLFYTLYNPIEITKVYITNDAEIAADATNYIQFSIESGSDNTGGTVLFEADTRSNHESVVAAGTLYPFEETEGTVAKSQYVVLNVTEGGDKRITDCMVILYFVEGSPASE